MAILEHERVLTPEPDEGPQINLLRDALEAQAATHQVATLVGPDGTEITLPVTAFEVLRAAVRDLARGCTVTIIPSHRELTTKEAADILHVSRQFLVKLLDRGDIPHHHVGTHRRLNIADVLAYKEERAARRQEKLGELARESQDVPGGYR